MQARGMRNYNLQHPFHDSPLALPWRTDPPETIQKRADITRNHAKATMQAPAEPRYGTPASRLHTPSSNPGLPGPKASSPARASAKNKKRTRP